MNFSAFAIIYEENLRILIGWKSFLHKNCNKFSLESLFVDIFFVSDHRV